MTTISGHKSGITSTSNKSFSAILAVSHSEVCRFFPIFALVSDEFHIKLKHNIMYNEEINKMIMTSMKSGEKDIAAVYRLLKS